VARSTDSNQAFVARQPILDRTRRVMGYELLFRPGHDAVASGCAGEVASARVITEAVLSIGLDVLTRGHRAFINFTRPLLLEGAPAALPADRVVIEILEDVRGDAEVIEACRKLRGDGYSIALDDFRLTEETAPLIALADFIKVDVLSTSEVELAALDGALSALARRPLLLAEKVETVQQFDAAMRAGFACFQGYFFGRPVTWSARQIPEQQAGRLRLLQALNDPNMSVQQFESLVKHDSALCYRVLRAVNSAAFAQRTNVNSIHQALILLGRDVVRRWLWLWTLASLAEGAHPELAVMSIVRARSCELLASRAHGEEAGAEGFLLGLCSLLDVALERPMEALLDQLPLTEATKAALSGRENRQRHLIDCVAAHERGDWDRCFTLAPLAGVDTDWLPVAHANALDWAREFERLDG
jgi:EAL and modified HD-GYP domain-containing signal transduction protein